ncbi:MAG TPA: hypothetical protein VME19_13630 [Streptosporangiaceae bacterium]|nr:hypothetical protein [Streptosporangiaceae bacterium]
MTDLLAEATAELYDADPDDFMPRRGQLAGAAREAGQPDVAKQITALRKPTRSAWVVNHLVRADPEVTVALAALATQLRAPLDAPKIRELTAARARLVDELTQQAFSLAGHPSPPAGQREEVAATFDAAIADPAVAGRLGTLVRAARWAGFGLDPDAPLPAPAPAPAKTKKPAPAEAIAETERRRREKIHLAERAVVDADEALHTANVAEQQLEDTVRRLEAELADARERLAEARRQSYRAESRQRRANATLGRLRE